MHFWTDVFCSLQPVDLSRKLSLAHGVVCGMDYLHSVQPHPVIHGDLKMENILVGDKLIAKVSTLLTVYFITAIFMPKLVQTACREWVKKSSWMAFPSVWGVQLSVIWRKLSHYVKQYRHSLPPSYWHDVSIQVCPKTFHHGNFVKCVQIFGVVVCTFKRMLPIALHCPLSKVINQQRFVAYSHHTHPHGNAAAF